MNFGEIKFLLKHSSVYGLGSIIGQAVSFLLLPLYTRYLTPTDYGVMALVDVTRWAIGLIISLGVISALSRFYYEYEDTENRNLVISSAYWVAFLVLIVFSPVIHFISPLLSTLVFHSDAYIKIFSVSLLSLLFGLIADLGTDYLRIRAESVRYVKISMVRMVFTIGCNIFFVVYLRQGVLGIFYANLLSSIVFALFFSVMVLRVTKLGFSRKIASDMLAFSIPLVFSNIFRGIINESDKLFINYFFSPFETGIYSISQKIGTAIHALITSSFLQTYLPRRFEIMKQDDAKENYAHILNYYLIVMCSIGLLVSLFGAEILILMTTEKYYSASKYIPPIVLSMILFGMKYHFEIGVVISKETKYIAYINGLSATINIGLNYLLIQRFGVAGAVISANCSYLTTTLLSLYVSQNLYYINYYFVNLISIIFLAILCYLLSLLTFSSSIVIAIPIKLSLFILYVFLLYTKNIIPKELASKFFQKLKCCIGASP